VALSLPTTRSDVDVTTYVEGAFGRESEGGGRVAGVAVEEEDVNAVAPGGHSGSLRGFDPFSTEEVRGVARAESDVVNTKMLQVFSEVWLIAESVGHLELVETEVAMSDLVSMSRVNVGCIGSQHRNEYDVFVEAVVEA
jgi:hypothetical protein